MELLELSRKKLVEENRKLHEKIIADYEYDLVIFIARGSFYIGEDMARFNDTELLEIFAKRKGGKLKKLLSPILRILPRNVKEKLRNREVNSNYHEKHSDRMIYFDSEKWANYRDYKNILLVDDSVDTGYSMKYAKEAVEKYFEGATVKVASLNCFTKSEKIINTDYYIYKDKLLMGPWSNDSVEHGDFIIDYCKWHKGQVK